MKKIIVGVTGGIAAFKTCQLVSDLTKHYEVQVIMSKNATNFINPLTFETLTNRKCLIDTFDRNFKFEVEHIAVAKWADLFVVAPASTNIIAKLATGICDDMLTTTFLACKASKIIVPAMNTNMYENPITLKNIETLKSYGMHIVDATSGYLACGDIGKGKMADIRIIKESIEMFLETNKPLLNKKVLISAGPTQEAIDPVRYITNHSSGKMGYELAIAARNMGAEVTLISGVTNLDAPYMVNVINIKNAKDMYEAFIKEFQNADFIIKAAAVADYTPLSVSDKKIKKSADDLDIKLKRTDDILKYLGENKKSHQIICGFALETNDLIENARKKLINKKVDMIVANNILVEGAGFQGNTNIATLLTNDELIETSLQSKAALASMILNKLIELESRRGK